MFFNNNINITKINVFLYNKKHKKICQSFVLIYTIFHNIAYNFVIMRKIPVTMATQHPDNIFPAYFNNNAFISTTDEVEEAYLAWSDL